MSFQKSASSPSPQVSLSPQHQLFSNLADEHQSLRIVAAFAVGHDFHIERSASFEVTNRERNGDGWSGEGVLADCGNHFVALQHADVAQRSALVPRVFTKVIS